MRADRETGVPIGVSCRDRKSTRLNSSHTVISYAVFCLEQKSTRLNSSHTVISYAVFCLNKISTRLDSSVTVTAYADSFLIVWKSHQQYDRLATTFVDM